MKIVQTFSGGLDSTVLLWHLVDQGHEVRALSIDYGQRHRCELDRAATLARQAGVEHLTVDLSGLRAVMGGSSQTDDSVAVPRGHYEEESMKQTVVPNRNMLLLATAAAWAISTKSDAIAYAAHAGDHAIYPDCREDFAIVMGEAIALADWHEVELLRPFVQWSKADIAKRGEELNVPLADTWSCYEGAELHYGLCGTCVERIEAFELAGVADSTEYARYP